VSEEIGHRQTMEDSCTIVQHLNITSLCVKDLSPHSFFAVYDGHGGAEASFYLSQNLHVNVAHGLLAVANDLLQLLENTSVSCDLSINDSKDHQIVEVIDDHKGDLSESEEKYEEKNGGEIEIIHNGLSSSSNVDKKDCSESEDKYETNSKKVSMTGNLDAIVIKSLKESFQKTDDEFIKTSAHPQHGSTATTALILGNYNIEVCNNDDTFD
jgi:serine/threonine protein phosphatase PrpC